MSGTRDAVAPPRTRLILAASCLAMAALGMNGTAIMAALPTMRHDLGLNPTQLEWAINAYLVVSAACIIPGGWAGDQFGARRVSTVGLALFALASAVVATAPCPVALLAGRALQGLAAALAVPGTLATVSEAALPERRASAIGAWAIADGARRAGRNEDEVKLIAALSVCIADDGRAARDAACNFVMQAGASGSFCCKHLPRSSTERSR